MPSSSTVADQTPYGWDWSQTTHDFHDFPEGNTRQLLLGLTTALGGAHVLPSDKGFQGWTDSLDVFDCDGYRLGKVFYGGKRDDVHVMSTSAAADLVRSDLTGRYHAKTSRVDTRVDSMVPFEDLAAILEEAGETYGSQILEMKSRAGVKGDRHDTGRTVYLGAASSAVRVRLYEKWLESPGQYPDGLNRVEVQLRPPSKMKHDVSRWSRAETFCASKVTQGLAQRLGDDLAPAASLHVNRGTPDLQRSLEAMGRQYGGVVDRWLNLSEGDFDTVLHHLLPKEDD